MKRIRKEQCNGFNENEASSRSLVRSLFFRSPLRKRILAIPILTAFSQTDWVILHVIFAIPFILYGDIIICIQLLKKEANTPNKCSHALDLLKNIYHTHMEKESYTSKERIEWLTSIQPDFDINEWNNRIAYHPLQIKNIDFFEETETVEEEICPKRICGLEYDPWTYNSPQGNIADWKYYWSDLFFSLKRLDGVIDSFKTRDSLIAHIHRDDDKKHVKQYGNYYFTTSGQHRLALAKFIKLDSVRVSVKKYKLNKSLFSREHTLENSLLFLREKEFLKSYKRDINSDYLTLKGVGRNNFFIKKELIGALENRYSLLENDNLKSFLAKFKQERNDGQSLSIDNFEQLPKLDKILTLRIEHLEQLKR